MVYYPGEVRRSLIGTLAEATGINGTVADGIITTLDLSAEGTIVPGNTYLIGTEEMLVTAVTSDASDEATVIRGVDDTTPAAQSAAAMKLVNIFTPRLPKEHVENTQLVRFHMVGGLDPSGASASGPIGDIRDQFFTFLCYGATEVAAWEYYETVRSAIIALEQTTSPSEDVRFIGAVNTVPGQQLLDTDGKGDGWPYVVSTWNITIGLK